MTSLKIGDTVTIRRGKRKAEAATVETLSEQGSQVVVKLADGFLEVHNASNLKAPDEATIGASALADVITDLARTYPPAGDAEGPMDALEALADRLGMYLPGFSAKSIGWPDMPA